MGLCCGRRSMRENFYVREEASDCLTHGCLLARHLHARRLLQIKDLHSDDASNIVEVLGWS